MKFLIAVPLMLWNAVVVIALFVRNGFRMEPRVSAIQVKK